jgi:hypothetical protein
LKKQIDYTVPVGLLICLFALSFFKDDLTPDYLNTEAAAFLAPENEESRIMSIGSNFSFWFMAFVYSLAFAIIPYYIIKISCDLIFARYVFLLFVAIFLGEYLLILINMKFLDVALIPKINRFYHSPIPTLFLLAAYTINTRMKK